MRLPRIRKAILPAAGLGTRLRPLTHVLPKELLPVGEQVVIQYVLAECAAARLDQLLVVMNRRKPSLIDACHAPAHRRRGEPTPRPPRRTLFFVNQARQLGLAHAVLQGRAFVGRESFVVANADTIIDGGEESLLARMIRVHGEHGAAATIATERVPRERVVHYGILDPAGPIAEVFRVRRIVEKPEPGEAPSEQAIAARYVFTPEIFAACTAAPRNEEGEMDLTAAMTWLAQRGRPVVAVSLGPDQHRLDIGSHASYAAAFAHKAGPA